jgi:uncharacterized protein (TIGR00730 family)
VLETLLEISRSAADTNDWQLVEATLADMAAAFSLFHPHRNTPKLAVFGSARSRVSDPAYRLAMEVAEEAVNCGFEVITGAGGGVMEAANRGAGTGKSFGLDVQLPFEHFTNLYIDSPERLLSFSYFHTRKLFFLRETDAVVVLPGGFGTFDELFEALTLIQTAKNPPVPVVLLAPLGDNYWDQWQNYIDTSLLERGFVSAQDSCIYRSANSAKQALRLIEGFYKVFKDSHYKANKLQLNLNYYLPENEVILINKKFSYLLLEGEIYIANNIGCGSCLELCFDQRQIGGLYALIEHLNGLDLSHYPQ